MSQEKLNQIASELHETTWDTILKWHEQEIANKVAEAVRQVCLDTVKDALGDGFVAEREVRALSLSALLRNVEPL